MFLYYDDRVNVQINANHWLYYVTVFVVVVVVVVYFTVVYAVRLMEFGKIDAICVIISL